MSELQDKLDKTAKAIEPVLWALLKELEKDNDDN